MSKYYEINEQTARTAKGINSFYDYKEGEATKAYKCAVDDVFSIADKVATKRPESAEKAAILADRFSRRYAEWVNKKNRIDAQCPSILICGGGNFPTAKKNKQNAARDRLYAEYEEINEIVKKIKRLEILVG